jgi:arylamine N-acetyltransferase
MATRQRKTNFALEQREQTTSGALAAEGRAARGNVVMNLGERSERNGKHCSWVRSAASTNWTTAGGSGTSVLPKRAALLTASPPRELALALTSTTARDENARFD